MATSWPTTDAVTSAALVPATHFAADKAVSTGRVGHIVDMILCLMRTAFDCGFAEQTTQAVSAAPATLASFYMTPPDWSEHAGTLEMTLEAKVDANNADIWLKDSVSGNTGTPVNLTNAAYADKTITLTIDASWGDTERLIVVQGQVSNGADTLAVRETQVRTRFTD